MGIFPVWFRGALADHNIQLPTTDCLTISDWEELIDYLNKL
jgi:hypothetical protein